jgi:putative ABC transport system permease protein
MSGWGPALRIARRSVKRDLGRAALVVALVGLPVAAASMVDVVARTISNPQRQAERDMGSADLTVFGDGDVTGFLPNGSRAVDAPSSRMVGIARGANGVTMAEPTGPSLPGVGHFMVQGSSRAGLVYADARDPLQQGSATVKSGRAPTKADEVMLTQPLATRLKLRIGDSIHTAKGVLTITGIAGSPYCLSCEQIVTLPQGHQGSSAQLVALPPGTNPKTVAETLNRHGFHAFRRGETGDSGGSGDSLRAAVIIAVIAGFGLLEVVLLAGTAFAVGARRQVRTLGLVSASGGDAKQVRNIVLAQGVVLGALGGIAGVALGCAVAVGLRPLWEHLDDAVISSYVFKPLELLIIGGVGVGAGLAAAAVPAIGAARMRPVDALSGRYRVSNLTRTATPLAGLVVLGAGIACGLAANAMMRNGFKDYEAQLKLAKQTGAYVDQPTPIPAAALALFGALLLVAAIILLAPAAIALLSKLSARLPVATRLAVRDASRHRHRTAPTTSAIAVAVAGSVLLACVVAANNHATLVNYHAALPPHTIAVPVDEATVETGSGTSTTKRGGAGGSTTTTSAAAHAIAATLPGSHVYTLRQPADAAPGPRGDNQPIGKGAPIGGAGLWATPDCKTKRCATAAGNPLVLGDADGLAIAALGGTMANAKEELAKGRVVVFGPRGNRGEQPVTIHAGGGDVTVPGYVIERGFAYGNLPVGLMPASVAQAHGWGTEENGYYISYPASTTRAQENRALDAAAALGAAALIERGPEKPTNTPLLIAILAAAFITLAGAAISIALSAAEGRADLATLAAVGAAPRRRRALAASQALVIAGVGCLLGVALGTFVAYTVRSTSGAPGFVVPWANLALTALAVPALAMAVAAVFSPSRLPLVRRAA